MKITRAQLIRALRKASVLDWSQILFPAEIEVEVFEEPCIYTDCIVHKKEKPRKIEELELTAQFRDGATENDIKKALNALIRDYNHRNNYL